MSIFCFQITNFAIFIVTEVISTADYNFRKGGIKCLKNHFLVSINVYKNIYEEMGRNLPFLPSSGTGSWRKGKIYNLECSKNLSTLAK